MDDSKTKPSPTGTSSASLRAIRPEELSPEAQVAAEQGRISLMGETPQWWSKLRDVFLQLIDEIEISRNEDRKARAAENKTRTRLSVIAIVSICVHMGLTGAVMYTMQRGQDIQLEQLRSVGKEVDTLQATSAALMRTQAIALQAVNAPKDPDTKKAAELVSEIAQQIEEQQLEVIRAMEQVADSEPEQEQLNKLKRTVFESRKKRGAK